MTNLVRVEAEFPNLTTGSGIVRCIDGILEEELRQPPGRIGLRAL
jgi:hypothetical protein